MSTYSSLLKTPGVGRIIAAQLTARFPFGMLSLAFLLHVEHVHHSYAAAGLVLAATSIGQAISGPLTSRWMGRWGMRPVLLLTLSVCLVTMLAFTAYDFSVPAFMALGFVTGLSVPPVQPAVRTIYPKMVNSSQLTPLFSLDASAQEIIWVAGPVITTFVGTQVGTREAIWLAALFLVGGGIWFIASPEVGRVRIPRSKRSFGKVLARPTVLLATVAGFLLIGACAAVEAGVVALFGEGSADSGIALAVFAAGSLVGGLALGHVPVGPWALGRRLAIVFVGMVLAIFATGLLPISGALLVAGVGIAPALAVMFAIVSSSVKFSDTAEAYGWAGTGQLIGSALGSAIAGFWIDRIGGQGGLVVAAAFAFVGVVVGLVFHRALPDLRGRDASPLPDTEPVPVQAS
ncbi:MFS transporter [Frigoribacterium sp. ACAM 257]|uniref:MFS transporter n=1 Tax=unclassified Frigoribacterium TaxID=2627005 RepID=UPI0011B94EB9|nr:MULTISPECIES: MFS transporter [unclassified Frigoribacterium]MBD8583659.1 MFS transporter [Frigoribacterium sp. CFBP 8766]MBD8610438.1 MFS transporter [Frigoribacterium sp. CFBP 13729]MBP1191582.1 MFS family permease [Frigoribacterium sp. PvP032]TWX37050.1 MFS transporter [Frigoribacterium sp. ACAM 257]